MESTSPTANSHREVYDRPETVVNSARKTYPGCQRRCIRTREVDRAIGQVRTLFHQQKDDDSDLCRKTILHVDAGRSTEVRLAFQPELRMIEVM